MTSNLSIIPPPAGQISNFIKPHSIAVRVTIANAICISLSVIAVVLRMYTRYWLVNAINVDDYLLLAALACAVIASVIAQIMMPYGFGKHAWDVSFTNLTPYLKRWMIGSIIYSCSILLTKLSFMFLFRRIFTNDRSFAIQWWIILFIIIGYSVAGILSSLLACIPIQMMWDRTITDGQCLNTAAFYIANACLNVMTELAIIALPMIPIWQTFSNLRRRIPLLFLFGTGSFTCIVGMIRIKYTVDYLNSKSGDITYEPITFTIWTVIEMHSAIICACAATLKPFIQRYFGPIVTNIQNKPNNYIQTTIHINQYTHGEKSAPRLVSCSDPRSDGDAVKV